MVSYNKRVVDEGDELGTFEKLKQKIYSKPIPNDITFEELVTFVERYGCEVKSGGNHIKICYKRLGRVVPIPRHGKDVKEAYIQQVKALINEIKEEETI